MQASYRLKHRISDEMFVEHLKKKDSSIKNNLARPMLRGSNDDGPKLREEKQFEDFYTDLEKDKLMPVLSKKTDSANTSSEGDINKDGGRKTHMKQLMFNGTISLEPIKLNHNTKTFKRCSISISELDSTKRERLHRGTKKSSASSCLPNDKGSYITKFSRVAKNREISAVDEKSLAAISKNLENFGTEYDMDEQDELYLQFLNRAHCQGKMTHAMFELLMTALEREWNHLEKQIPPRTISTNASMSDHQSKTGRLHYELYGSDDGTGKSSDQTCAVCGGGDSDSTNAIVFCDGCDVAVHQECYGIVFIPEGQWLCRRCLVSKNRKVNCLFCPSNTGAFKQTDTGSWAHVVCGLWIPELFFANIHYMEPIEGAENISRSRWKLVCSICKQKMGACIQCAHKNCFTAFHVTCAKRAGLFMNYGGSSIAEVASNQINTSHTPKCLCSKHAPSYWSDCTEGIIKTRRYFSDHQRSADNSHSRKEGSNLYSSHTQQKNKWKTNRGTPIAPHMFANITRRILKLLGIIDLQGTSYNICKYWSMKRELKRGSPLVRTFDPSSYNTLEETELLERLSVTDVLMNDLVKLQTFTNLVCKRTAVGNSLRVVNAKLQKLTDFPNEYMIKLAVVDKFVSSEPFKALESQLADENILVQLSKWKSCKVEEVSSFKEEITAFLRSLESLPNASRIILSNSRKAEMLLMELFNSVKGLDAKELLPQDFIISTDPILSVEPRKWKASYWKNEEGLSDVEELSSQEKRDLKFLLKSER